MKRRRLVLALCSCILCAAAGGVLAYWLVPFGAPSRTKSPKTETTAKPRADLSGWSDEDLKQAVLNPKADHWARRLEEVDIDAALCEIIRRKGPAWESFLSEHAKADSGMYLEMLTALRRVQGRPDPVQIGIEGPAEIEATWPARHQFKVALTHADGEPTRIPQQAGGDYRSGRQERWRIEVCDSTGAKVPVRDRLGYDSGGILRSGVLGPGDTWNTALDLASYVTIPAPGSYTVRIQYHNARRISHQQDVSDLILCQSPQVKLTVKMPVVKITATIRQEVKECLGLLDEKAALKVIVGTYCEDFHDFIAPDSPQGRLLKIGWPAIPQMLKDLQRWRASPERRAWLLSLLFTITSLNDPLEGSALGNCSYRMGGWQLWFGPNGETTGGGMGCGGTGTRGGGAISKEDQKELIDRWVETVKNVEFQESN